MPVHISHPRHIFLMHRRDVYLDDYAHIIRFSDINSWSLLPLESPNTYDLKINIHRDGDTGY